MIGKLGIYTDEFIHTGEFIVEYRGENVGNAIANQREKDYNALKIESDCVFRIDHMAFVMQQCI